MSAERRRPASGDNTGAIVSVTRTTVRVRIELDREVPYHDERIANPDRVFVDLRGRQARRRVKRA